MSSLADWDVADDGRFVQGGDASVKAGEDAAPVKSGSRKGLPAMPMARRGKMVSCVCVCVCVCV